MESDGFVSQDQPYSFGDEISNVWTSTSPTDPFFTAEGYNYTDFHQGIASDSFPFFEAEKTSEGKSSLGEMAPRRPSLPDPMASASSRRYSTNPQDLSTQAMFTRPIAHPTPVESFDRSTAKRVRVDPQAKRREGEDVERCYSQTGSQSNCCSSCPGGEPCIDPQCAEEVTESCGECACGIPKCSCPDHDPARNRGLEPESESSVQSRLQDWTNSVPSVWNPQSHQDPSLRPENNVDQSYNMYNGMPYNSVAQSPLHTPPSAANLTTPFSPVTGLQTPLTSNFGTPANSYDHGLGALSGAGAVFQPAQDASQWMNSGYGHDIPQFNFGCAWEGCDDRFQNNDDWLSHCFDTHVAPQMMVHCPMPQESCPENIAPNFLSHLRANHGFDFTSPALLCPAPNCDPVRVIPNAGMLQNHFSRAHAMPAQGSLVCEVQRCNSTFQDLNEFSTHLTHQHAFKGEQEIDLNPRAGLVRKAPHPEISRQAILPSPASDSSNDDDDSHICKWLGGGTKACGLSFDSSTTLHQHIIQEHLASLDKKSGYKCSWKGCTRADKRGDENSGFSQRGKLERHMATHTNCKFQSGEAMILV